MKDDSPLADGLLRIHKVISRGLNTSIKKCDEYLGRQGIPREESAGFYMYLRALKYVTHSHHLSEDEIAFPYFRNNIEAPYSRLQEDHQAISVILEELDQFISDEHSESPDKVEKLRGLLNEFKKVWEPHINVEEENFNTQKLHAVSGIKEQMELVEKLAEHSRKSMGPGPVSLPFLFYNLEGSERAEFMKPIPWMLKKVLVPVVWKSQWRPMSPFLLLESD